MRTIALRTLILMITVLTGCFSSGMADQSDDSTELGSGTDVSHYFVRFFAVVSEVFCLKKCCVFFVLLLCVLDSFCN